jgi:hypothetical protein
MIWLRRYRVRRVAARSASPFDSNFEEKFRKGAPMKALLAMLLLTSVALAADPLPSWNDGRAKQSIVDFVTRVTTPSNKDFVPPAERIATFDNDGTLWAEPFASLLKGDLKAALAGGEPAIFEIVMATHSGMTTEAFDKIVTDWIATAKHPVTKRLYTEMVYQAMLELLAHLRASGFKTFIVSGGGIDFMRPLAEKVYGIPPEQVVGSSGKLDFQMRNGTPVLVKLPELNFIDDKAAKAVGIQQHIGRRPILAFGNSDGDLQMLQWTAAGSGPRYMGLIHHTDAMREWAYDRKSSIGQLDKALDEATAKGWTVVDMKADWKTIYAGN